MFPADIRHRKVVDWSGAEVGRVVAFSTMGAGALFVRLRGAGDARGGAEEVLPVSFREVSALRPGEVALRLTLPQLLRASGSLERR